uniref:Si:ch211-256a21.4 n=1 Tax=Amphiprion percula TaxID=161767 RepID=A0A3P8SJU4_AMPPE
DSISRFRFAQSCLGLAGCLCVCYAVCTPFWLNGRGLWTEWNNTTERVFGVLSTLMAVSTGGLCLVFALCWTSQTVRSYSNTRSLLMAGQALYPTTLLLLTMASTFFFLLSWSFFTYQHREEIRQDFSRLGSSYWLGALGWFLLLIVEMIVFIAEQAIVPDILPDLEKAVESWRISAQLKAAKRSFSDGYCPVTHSSNMVPKRYMSAP